MTTLHTPACWDWDPPALPQPNHRGPLGAWQAGRCAICGKTPHRLYEDHDHLTGLTRGFLCPGCNSREGVSADPVLQRYRERPPTAICGLLIQYGRVLHRDDVIAMTRLENALSDGDGSDDLSAAVQRVGLTFTAWTDTVWRRGLVDQR